MFDVGINKDQPIVEVKRTETEAWHGDYILLAVEYGVDKPYLVWCNSLRCSLAYPYIRLKGTMK